MTTINHTRTRAADLRPGDVVVSLDFGTERVVTSDPRQCAARGYVRVETDGEPINCHGDNQVITRTD